MGERPDFEAEGLLEDLEGEAREARLHLLETLFDAGVSLDALREAVATDRLTILPAEHELSARPRYSTRQICQRSGLPLEYYEAFRRAGGLAQVDADELAYDDDLEAARMIAGFYEAGLDRNGMLEVGRVLGRGSRRRRTRWASCSGRRLSRPG